MAFRLPHGLKDPLRQGLLSQNTGVGPGVGPDGFDHGSAFADTLGVLCGRFPRDGNDGKHEQQQVLHDGAVSSRSTIRVDRLRATSGFDRSAVKRNHGVRRMTVIRQALIPCLHLAGKLTSLHTLPRKWQDRTWPRLTWFPCELYRMSLVSTSATLRPSRLLLRLASGPMLSTGIPHLMSVAGQSRHFGRAFGTASINNASALLKPEAA